MKAEPHKYGGEPIDGGVDAWMNLMRMYLEDCRGSERAKVLTLLTFLHNMLKPGSCRNQQKKETLVTKMSCSCLRDLVLGIHPMTQGFILMFEGKRRKRSWTHFSRVKPSTNYNNSQQPNHSNTYPDQQGQGQLNHKDIKHL